MDHTAARVTAITIERFRDRAVSYGASSEAIHAAVAALPRTFTGPHPVDRVLSPGEP